MKRSVSHIEFLVEEPSAEAALRNLVPKIAGPTVSFSMHAHQGKKDLLRKLSGRLKGYRHWLPDDWRIVVLVDEDRERCQRLKEDLESTALHAGLTTKSSTGQRAPLAGVFQVLNRLAIEEMEAWFFGDMEAVVSAYPRIPANLARKRPYRDPDAIEGGTWEALERVLQRAGYHRGGLAKVKAARDISAYMDPQRNTSRSFQVFRDGLLEMIHGRQ